MSTDGHSAEFFETLSRIRDQDPREGGNPLSMIERLGAVKIPVQFFPPDPLTSHTEYYYNARQNILYRRKVMNNTKAIWNSVAIV